MATEPKADKPKKEEWFYANKKEGAKGPPVSLWKVETEHAKAPKVDGKIGTRRVAGYLRKGAKQGFIAFVNPKKAAEGTYETLFTGNLATTEAGALRLAIKPANTKETVAWASVSKKVPDDFLKSLGLDRDLIAKKRAEAASKAADAKAAKAAAPKP